MSLKFCIAFVAVLFSALVWAPSPRVTPVMSANGPGMIATIAGGGSADGGPATSASLDTPQGVALDAAGNLYVVDSGDCRVRKVTVSGTITTVAGTGSCGYGGDGGPATAAALKGPEGVAVDAAGDVYIADTGNCVVRKVNGGGTIATVAGFAGVCSYGGDGGAATAALLNVPYGVALDASGNLYIADTINCRIRMVNGGGTITTVAGTGTCGYGGDGGAATLATISQAQGISVDGSGNLYIADTNNCMVREVSGTTISLVAGHVVSGPAGKCSYEGEGLAATHSALFNPSGITVSAGKVYIGDTGNCLVRVIANLSSAGTATASTATTMTDSSANWPVNEFTSDVVTMGGSTATVTSNTSTVLTFAAWSPPGPTTGSYTLTGKILNTFAGSTCGYAGDGGPAAPVATNLNLGGTATASTATTMTDSSANWTVNTLIGDVVTMAGSTATVTSNTATVLTFAAWSPTGPTTGPYTLTPAAHAGDTALPVASTTGFGMSNSIRINPGGLTQEDNSVAGLTSTSIILASPLSNDHAAGEQVTRIPTPALNTPSGLAGNTNGLYIADAGNCRVRLVDGGGTINTVAGNGACGYGGDGGPELKAVLHGPAAVAVVSTLPNGKIYVADTGNCRVRMVTGPAITTVAGSGNCAYGGDGGAATLASLDAPQGVALDAGGNLYIADTTNCRVREVNSGGTITTVAGNGTCGYSGDNGSATAAAISRITGITFDAAGNMYIADTGNCLVRKVSGGTITTVAGNPAHVTTCQTLGGSYSGDGGAATSADMYYPHSVAVDAAGANLYIADTDNCRVRKVNGGTITTVAGNGICGYGGDNGAATAAMLKFPYGVTLDAGGNLYIADTQNCRVREVSGVTITTLAGTGACWFAGDFGLPTAASLNSPYGVALDSAGNVLIADTENNRVRGIFYTDPDTDEVPGDIHLPSGDSCGDIAETRFGLDLYVPWDFFSVPVPALFAAPNPQTDFAGTNVSAGSAQAVFAYFKANASLGTTVYDQDLNLNGVMDGVEYDRSVLGPGKAGPPTGIVSAQTAQLAFAQFKMGFAC